MRTLSFCLSVNYKFIINWDFIFVGVLLQSSWKKLIMQSLTYRLPKQVILWDWTWDKILINPQFGFWQGYSRTISKVLFNFLGMLRMGLNRNGYFVTVKSSYKTCMWIRHLKGINFKSCLYDTWTGIAQNVCNKFSKLWSHHSVFFYLTEHLHTFWCLYKSSWLPPPIYIRKYICIKALECK